MAKFVDGIKSLFTGGAAGPDVAERVRLEGEAARQREQQSISLERQRQVEQQNAADQDRQLGRSTRVPRGRRLLLAATGEQGLSSTLG